MSNETSGNSDEKKKGGRSWLRDVAFFVAGFFTGAGTTVGVGLATDTITTADLPGGGEPAAESQRTAA